MENKRMSSQALTPEELADRAGDIFHRVQQLKEHL
jgi:hypothetical protein